MQMGMRARRLELARQIETVLARHHHVEQHGVELEPAHAGARARGVVRRRHAEALLGQVAAEQVADLLIVVDDEHVRRVVGERARAAIFAASCLALGLVFSLRSAACACCRDAA